MKSFIVLLLLLALMRTILSQCTPGTVGMLRTDQSVDEGDGLSIFFLLDCMLVDTDFTIGLAYSNKGTTSNNDYDTSITTVDIPAGTMFFGTNLELSSDTTVEDDEVFCVVIDSVGSAGAGTDSLVLASVTSELSTSITILNDDTATVSITPALLDHTEGNTDTTVTVTLGWSNALQDTGFTQVLTYIDGTAMSSDYTPVSTTITLPADPVMSIEVPITIIGDTIIENDESFTVSLAMASAPEGYVDNNAITTHATSASTKVTILPGGILDTTPPTVINCPSDVVEFVELGQPGAQVTWIEPTATDASEPPPVTVVQNRTPGDFFVLGETTVFYTFTDSSANEATCTFIVMVQIVDSTPPTIAGCPSDIRKNVQLGAQTSAVVWTEPTATDLSGVVILSSRSHAPGMEFPVDQLTTVVYQFSDSSGNVDSCTFTVLVISEINPCENHPCLNGATCFSIGGQNIFCQCPVGFTGQICEAEINPCESHPCLNGATCFIIGGQNIFCQCSVGFTGQICDIVISPCDNSEPCQNGATCTPETGLTYTCTCPVEFEGMNCEQGVILNCPERPVIETTPDLSTRVFWPEPITSLDNKPLDVISNYKSGDNFLVGNTKIKYRFGNLRCVFTVTVQKEKEQDTTRPTVYDCTEDEVTVTVQSLHDNVTLSLPEPYAEDDSCDPVMVATSGKLSDTFRVGLTTVTYNFTDSSGNLAQCVIKVNISVVGRDVGRDHFTIFEFCPRPISINGSSVSATTQVTWIEPVFNSTNDVLLEQSHSPGEQFPFGITNVTYKLTDMTNTQISEFCIFSVKVNDVTPPNIYNCPELITARSCRGPRNVRWYEPFASDNSGLPVTNYTQTHSPGNSFFTFGATEVIYVFTDEFDNTAECSFLVTIHANGCSVLPRNVLVIVFIVTGSVVLLYVFLQVLYSVCTRLKRWQDNSDRNTTELRLQRRL